MLWKRKEPKRKSIAMTLLRDVRGSAAEKLAMFEKVSSRGWIRKRASRRFGGSREDAARFRGHGERKWVRAADRYP